MEGPPLKDLGYMNSWHDGPPEEFLACVEAGHRRVEVRLEECLHEYQCLRCGIKYKVDSSG